MMKAQQQQGRRGGTLPKKSRKIRSWGGGAAVTYSDHFIFSRFLVQLVWPSGW